MVKVCIMIERVFKGSVLEGNLERGAERKNGGISWVKAEELADGDANPDVDHQASNSAIFCVLWGMEENRGCPLLPSHPKLDCAHGGDVI